MFFTKLVALVPSPKEERKDGDKDETGYCVGEYDQKHHQGYS